MTKGIEGMYKFCAFSCSKEGLDLGNPGQLWVFISLSRPLLRMFFANSILPSFSLWCSMYGAQTSSIITEKKAIPQNCQMTSQRATNTTGITPCLCHQTIWAPTVVDWSEASAHQDGNLCSITTHFYILESSGF